MSEANATPPAGPKPDHGTAGSPDLSPELREEAENLALELILSGFDTYDEIVEAVEEHLSYEGEHPMTGDAAELIVDPMWRDRLAEQESWPEVTDPDRIAAVFTTLETGGITARMNFTCCQNCGVAEIGGDAADGARGYVFFHVQDTGSAAAGHGLYLSYGAFAGSARPGEDAAAIGREIAEAFTGAGLGVVWDGSSSTRIKVSPLDWRKRLPR